MECRVKKYRRLERKLHIACWGMIGTAFLGGFVMGFIVMLNVAMICF